MLDAYFYLYDRSQSIVQKMKTHAIVHKNPKSLNSKNNIKSTGFLFDLNLLSFNIHSEYCM